MSVDGKLDGSYDESDEEFTDDESAVDHMFNAPQDLDSETGGKIDIKATVQSLLQKEVGDDDIIAEASPNVSTDQEGRLAGLPADSD